ncbi:MAG: hypothetical protein JO034_08745 [Singulisphaera sp.]|nr:hypothetical protein [Singulisphaera sp.]
MIDLAGRSDDPGASFLDTAAIMANLDLVVTCDTSVAHLAGALGFPTWVALAAVPDWRWLLDREDSPWYPTLRLFRQVHQGIWVEPFERMARMLGDRVAARPGPGSIAVAITPGELRGEDHHPGDQERADHRPRAAPRLPVRTRGPDRRARPPGGAPRGN